MNSRQEDKLAELQEKDKPIQEDNKDDLNSDKMFITCHLFGGLQLGDEEEE